MAKISSIALLVAGIILLVYGFHASDSLSSSVSRAVNGAPSDKTVWLIALGILGVVIGGFGTLYRRSP